MLGNLRVTANEARGEYIWILGDDDLVKPNAIVRVLNVIKSHRGVALIYLNYAYTHATDPDSTGTSIDSWSHAHPFCQREATFLPR